jgi:glycosyltransferase involved in cell wall biosynthesis
MIRVLCFGRYADENFGGVERVVQNTVRALEGEVEYVNLVAGRRFRPVGQDWHCEIVRAPSIASVASLPLCPTMPSIARRLHRERAFDLAHLHFPDPMSHLAALALPSTLKTVITWHSDIVRQRNLVKPYLPFQKRFVSRAEAVIAATPAHFESMPQLGALTRPEQRVVVPYGFDLAPLRAPHPFAAELRRRHGSRIVFALGRHVYYKGFEYLLRAMAAVPDAVLLLGGEGPLTVDLKRVAAQSGAADRIVFAGLIPEADLGAYYQACEVFCLPSVEPSEAFAVVQVEAMSCGKPVVCADLKNGVTWVNQDGKTGLVVPPRDSEALAGALRRLLDDADLRERMGAAGSRRADEQFSLAALREGTLMVYRRALA